MVARNVFLLLLNFSAWSCLAGCCLTKSPLARASDRCGVANGDPGPGRSSFPCCLSSPLMFELDPAGMIHGDGAGRGGLCFVKGTPLWGRNQAFVDPEIVRLANFKYIV